MSAYPQSRHRSATLSDCDVIVCYSKNPCPLVVASPSCRIRFKAFRHPRCCIAAHDIMKLPKAGHEAAEWQAAMEALLLVAEHDGPTMFARIGMLRALNGTLARLRRSVLGDRFGTSGRRRPVGEEGQWPSYQR